MSRLSLLALFVVAGAPWSSAAVGSLSVGGEASFGVNIALLLVSAVSSFFCADCSLLERSFAVVRCLAIAALVWRCNYRFRHVFGFQVFLAQGAALRETY